MKKALTPILIILGLIALLAVVATWYEKKYGPEGPFPNHHHH